MFLFRKKKRLTQITPERWMNRWRNVVPEECRNVPVTADGKTVEAFICMNHHVVMLQDGLLMEASFFDVCEFFQKAGYHVIWLMRCTQDIADGYLKKAGKVDSEHTRWVWRKPTTNFGRWMSDNSGASILIQTDIAPGDTLQNCKRRILQRVIWTDSDDPAQMIPGRTTFVTASTPATPMQLLAWINGAPLSQFD